MAKRRRKPEPGFVEASLGLFILAWLSLPFIPQTKHLVQTTQGIILTGLGSFGLWVVLMLIILFVRNRTRANSRTLDLTFDDAESGATQSSLEARKRRTPSEGLATPAARDFEHEVADLFNVLTPYKAIAVGGSGDGGVDVKVYTGERLVGIIQCKRYNSQNALAPGHVRELYACKEQFGVKTAYLVTTAYFTPETQREADRLGIKLIDREKLENMRTQARAKLQQNDERIIKNQGL